MPRSLTGHTAIVALETDGAEALIRRLADEGSGVIVVARDGSRAGRLTADLAGGDRHGVEGGHGPVAVFSPEGPLEEELDALVELVTELSRAGRR